MPPSDDKAGPSWAPPERDIWSVSRLNREVRVLLDSAFGLQWVEGELSNVARPASGHLYFSLKDASAQVRCAMFRQRNRNVAFTPNAGDKVLVRARIGLYEPRGDYQLIVEHMEPAGEGALRAQYEALKRQLAQEGLFDADAKRPIPALPARIGIITSPSGAAVRDVLKVLTRRFAAIPVLIYPVAVQGATAAGEIADALSLASRRADCDVLILTRGGGSLEDLWCFNDERVARAIRASTIPVVCGVGHEIDVTIADFAADLRAPTPSAAAELVVPDSAEWMRRVTSLQDRLAVATRRSLGDAAIRSTTLTERLDRQHPGHRLTTQIQRLDELEQRLTLGWQRAVATRRATLDTHAAHLARVAPSATIARHATRIDACRARLDVAVRRRLDGASRRIEVAQRTLAAVNPLATLDRGYAIVSALPVGPSASSGPTILRDASSTSPGDRVEARLARGRIVATVEAVSPGSAGDKENNHS